jgi:hypothetical protein
MHTCVCVHPLAVFCFIDFLLLLSLYTFVLLQILHYSALWSLVWLIPVGLYEDIWGAWGHLFKMPLTFKLVLYVF